MGMKHLFSTEGDAALLATMAAWPLLAFDFDGTLAPIVARPDDARVPMGVAQRLQRLAARLPVAIISGRRVDDVRDRLQFVPAHIIGNHGAEDPMVGLDEFAVAALQGLRERLRDRHQAALADAGVWVEDKGASLALHYRLARDREAALAAIAHALDDLDPGLRVFGGKMVSNIVAQEAPDKAEALARLTQRCRAEAALFVGDDVNAEPVFARGESRWLTVRVGRDDPTSKARFFLSSLAELPLMLDRMLAAMPGPDPH
jgi:trehalose 6-phosphate phosphatase